MKKIILAIILTFIFPSPVYASKSPELAGRNCGRLGAVRTFQDSVYACISTRKKLKKWVLVGSPSTTTTTVVSYPYGSYQNPVLKNTAVLYSLDNKPTLEITVHGSDFNVMEFVCLSNRFNDGCDSYTRAPASYSPIRWVRVDLTVKNVSSGLIDMFWQYSWSAVLQGSHYGENKSASSINDLGDLEFLPGSQVTTSVYIQVYKSAGTLDLMFAFKQSGYGSWYYFQA